MRGLWMSTSIVAAALVVAACRDDGRTLREPRPDQTGSVSTTAPTTDPPQPDALDGGLEVPTTLAITAAPTLAPTVVTLATLPAENLEVPALVAPWPNGGVVATRNTCDGENVSPELTWTTAPDWAVEVAITLTDDDAPDFVHWAVAGIDPSETGLAEGLIPEFATEAVNSGNEAGYTGPCPPEGETHTYVFTVWFLREATTLTNGAPAADLLEEIRAAASDSASVTATYSRR